MCYRTRAVESGASALLKIYHAQGTRSVRPIWLCLELGLRFEVETIPFTPEFLASPAWRAISPAGKLPLMTDGEVAIFESGAIVEHILDRYGDGRLRPPPATPQSALYLQWCWFAEATLIRPLGIGRMLRYSAEQTGADAAGEAVEKAREAIAVVDQALADGRPFLLGDDFTAADIMMGYALALLENHRILNAHHAHALAYVAALKTREPLVRALAA
jgi:glutathione S-transferase